MMNENTKPEDGEFYHSIFYNIIYTNTSLFDVIRPEPKNETNKKEKQLLLFCEIKCKR